MKRTDDCMFLPLAKKQYIAVPELEPTHKKTKLHPFTWKMYCLFKNASRSFKFVVIQVKHHEVVWETRCNFMLGDRRYSSFESKLSNRAVVNKFLTSLKDFMAEQNPTYHQAFLFFLVFFFGRQPEVWPSRPLILLILKFIFSRQKTLFWFHFSSAWHARLPLGRSPGLLKVAIERR